jgi:glycine/D-amino acid oxidase-like deaminating enzyme
MKSRSTNAFWLLKNGLVNSYPSLQEDFACDVLVVGGGITGSLLAFQLSSEGYRTAVIDKGDVGFGSTSATTSMLQYELDRPLFALTETIGKTAASEIYLAGVEAIRSLGILIAQLNLDCGYQSKESMYVAQTPKDAAWLKQEFEARKEIGLDVHWLTAEQLFAGYQARGVAGILSTSGGSLDAYRLSHELLRYCQSHYGLYVFDHTRLITVKENKNILRAHIDGEHVVEARWIIYATGYESQSFFKEKIVELNSTYVCISEPLPHIPPQFENTIFWTTDTPYLYIRSTTDKRIIIGGEDERFINPELRDDKIDQKKTALVACLREIFPGLAFVPDFSWAGTFGVTPDSLPYIGPHEDYPRSFFVLGYGGNGITFSVLAMKIISDAIAGRSNKFLEYLKFKR